MHARPSHVHVNVLKKQLQWGMPLYHVCAEQLLSLEMESLFNIFPGIFTKMSHTKFKGVNHDVIQQ